MARKQLPIPGTERKVVKEIDAAAAAYVDARDKRIKLTEQETQTQEALVAVMRKHKLTAYRDDDAAPPLIVTLSEGKTKAKVQRLEEDAG